jgi:hypothetical protein
MGGRFASRARALGATGLAAAAFLALAASPAPAQDDATKAKLEDLQKQIDEIRARSSTGGGAADSGSVADALKKGIPGKKGNSTVKFYGTIRLDVIRDDSQPNNTQTIGWVLQETGAALDNDEDLTIHPRLTRFGMDVDAGKVAALKDAAVTGKIEIDFYNNGLAGQAESRAAVRMRHAYVNLDWGSNAVLAGQYMDVIAPLYPVVNPDMCFWGAGNLADRRAQVRFTHTRAVGAEGKLTLAAMIGETGAVDNQNLDGPGDVLRDGEDSARPTAQARVGWKFPWQKQTAEVGVWAHNAVETTTANIGSHARFESAAYGFDVNLPLVEGFYLKGEGWVGRNVDDVRGGIFQGVNAAGGEIRSQGGWAEVGWNVTKTCLVAVGATEDNPSGSDLAAGGRSRNRVVYGGVHFNWDPVEVGVDFMHWHTEFKGGGAGLDNRIQTYIAFSF